MTTAVERIAAKARSEPKLRFTSLAHHLTAERLWKSLSHIPKTSAPGCDGQTVKEAKEEFENWSEPMLSAVHRKGYHPPPIRRVYIPKPGARTNLRRLNFRRQPARERPMQRSGPRDIDGAL